MTERTDRARRLRRIAGASLIGAAVIGVAIAVVVLFTGNGDEEPGPPYRFATERHVNEEGGYSFRYPPGWTVEEEESVTRVSSPDEEVVVSFGHGAEGSLEEAETRFVTEVQSRYRNARLSAVQIEQIGGAPALSVAGTGRNTEGVRVRFLAITVRVEGQNYSIGVFAPARSDPEVVVPPTQEIVNSFRVID